MNVAIIGGADGPTSVFLASKTDLGWINILGLIIIVLIMIPNIVYAFKFKDAKNKCTNKAMNIIEQIGRYSTMFLMVFNIGIAEFGFSSLNTFLAYLLGNAILILAYWIIWLLFFIKQKSWYSMALAIIPSCIFLLSGILLRHVLLIIAGVIFSIGHIYVTSKNAY